MNYAFIAISIMVFISIYATKAKTETNLNDDFSLLYRSQEEKAKEILPYLFFFLVLLALMAMWHENGKHKNARKDNSRNTRQPERPR